MADRKGFVAIDRNIHNWRWYTDGTTLRVWIHILTKCNFEEGNFKGTIIKPGQWFTSYDHIAEALKITKSQARTAVCHLKDTQEIACENAHYGMLITVINWEKYNGVKKYSHARTQANRTQIARKSHAGTQANRTNITNKQCLSNNITKEPKDIDTYIPENSSAEIVDSKTKHHYGENGNVLLTEAEYNKLHIDYPNADELINYLDLYIPDKSYKSKSHYSAIKRWVADAVSKKDSKISNSEKFAQGKRAF